MELDLRELAWAAGLFEGEGCIFGAKDKTSGIVYPLLSLAMTDLDVVERFHRAVGGLGKISKWSPRKSPYNGKPLKQMWQWDAGGHKLSIAVIPMLWFGLGERRRAKAAEVLHAWKTCPRKRQWYPKECTVCSAPTIAVGRCNRHYQAVNPRTS